MNIEKFGSESKSDIKEISENNDVKEKKEDNFDFNSPIEKVENKEIDEKIENNDTIENKENDDFDFNSSIENVEKNIDNVRSNLLDNYGLDSISIGALRDADLSTYNKSIGIYMHVVDGEVKYIGRAIEEDNGGLRKRLSDYVREGDSGRKHESGQIIHKNLDKIETYVVVLDSVDKTKELEKELIKDINPEWNKQHKV